MNLVIFDFDGVIVDSEKEKFSALQKVLSNQGLLVKEKEYMKFIGKKRGAFIKEFFPAITKKQLNTIMNEIRVEDKQLKFTLLKGIKELLMNLNKKKNVIISLATGSDKATVMRILEKNSISNYFTTIATGDEVCESKQNSAVFEYVLKQHPTAENVYIIEDSPAGLEAAGKTSATVISLGLENKHAHIVVRDHEELLRWFSAQNNF